MRMGLTDCIGRSASPTGLLIFPGIGLPNWKLTATQAGIKKARDGRSKSGLLAGRDQAPARLMEIFVIPELPSAPRMPANFELLFRLNVAENVPFEAPLNWIVQSPWLSLLV
jgi:hypothetical protein